jgi:hypothetical protein
MEFSYILWYNLKNKMWLSRKGYKDIKLLEMCIANICNYAHVFSSSEHVGKSYPVDVLIS